MKRWTIIATIEAEPDMTALRLLGQIDRDLNRGDGLHLRTDTAVLQPSGKTIRTKPVSLAHGFGGANADTPVKRGVTP